MHLSDGESVRFNDGLNIDLYYVCRGAIKVTLISNQQIVLKDCIDSGPYEEDELANADDDDGEGGTAFSTTQKTITLKRQQYFDHLVRQRGELSKYSVVSVTAISPIVHILKLLYSDNAKFVGTAGSLKDKETNYELVLSKLPGLEFKGINRKRSVINSFEEVEFEPNTLLEEEGARPRYVYVILEGSLVLFKKPESMYDAKGRLIKVHEIELQVNPKDSGNGKIGQKMTLLHHGLVCEDAVTFNETLSYSVKTQEQAVLLRCPLSQAEKWPEEVQNNLKVHTLDKYRVFYKQVQAVQEKLNTKGNKHILEMEVKMEKRVQKNYPVACRPTQDGIRAKTLKRINNFKPQFLVDKDERFAKFSKPLSGYITQKDEEMLERWRQLFVKPLTYAQVQKRTKAIRMKEREQLGQSQLTSKHQQDESTSCMVNFQNKNLQASLQRYTPLGQTGDLSRSRTHQISNAKPSIKQQLDNTTSADNSFFHSFTHQQQLQQQASVKMMASTNTRTSFNLTRVNTQADTGKQLSHLLLPQKLTQFHNTASGFNLIKDFTPSPRDSTKVKPFPRAQTANVRSMRINTGLRTNASSRQNVQMMHNFSINGGLAAKRQLRGTGGSTKAHAPPNKNVSERCGSAAQQRPYLQPQSTHIQGIKSRKRIATESTQVFSRQSKESRYLNYVDSSTPQKTKKRQSENLMRGIYQANAWLQNRDILEQRSTTNPEPFPPNSNATRDSRITFKGGNNGGQFRQLMSSSGGNPAPLSVMSDQMRSFASQSDHLNLLTSAEKAVEIEDQFKLLQVRDLGAPPEHSRYDNHS